MERGIPFVRQRPLLSPEPGEEELARHWTLSEADLGEVSRCRGEASRRRFALQLCTLRGSGRFVENYASVPVEIANHVGRQVGLAPVLFVDPPEREETEREQRRRIREYLGFRPFKQTEDRRLRGDLAALAEQDDQALLGLAEALLLSWKVELPAASTLERLVGAVSARVQEEVFERISAAVSQDMRARIDALLEVEDGDHQTDLARLKEDPIDATPARMLEQIGRYRLLLAMGAHELTLPGLAIHVVRRLADRVRRFDSWRLRRLGDEKRYAMMVCFLTDAVKCSLDHLVEMHDKYMTGMMRRSRNALQEKQRGLHRQFGRNLATVLSAIDTLREVTGASERAVAIEVGLCLGRPGFDEAVEGCRLLLTLEQRGYVDELRLRYAHLRRYFPAFVELPFEAEPGSSRLLDSLAIARSLNSGELRALPDQAPDEFVPASFRGALRNERGEFDRAVWEIGLAVALRAAFRSGDIFLPQSRHHVSFWNLIHGEANGDVACESLGLPAGPEAALDRLREEYDRAATAATVGLRENRFADIQGDKLKLRREQGSGTPLGLRKLRRAIEAQLPRVRIEDLLTQVDALCGFTRVFRPLAGRGLAAEKTYEALLAVLVAHGTNLGIAAMGESAVGLSPHRLQDAERSYLSPESLREANAVMVNYHHSLEESSVWGHGTASSSDGQRFGLEATSLVGSFCPRYFGHYEKALKIYSFVSDQHTTFDTRVISCSPREALYVLDGLLENDTDLRPHEHYTDTAGSTEHIFALCHLLGFSFMPRLKNLKHQQLWRIDREARYGRLDAILGATASKELIAEQWEQLARVAASLRDRQTPAHVIIQRLSRSTRSDRLARALTALGRMVKTIFILRYIHEEALRRRIRLQLNRGEARHALTRRLFFANEGRFRVGDREGLMSRASCLSLLSNAVIVWNTVMMARIVEELRAGGHEVLDEDLARVWPLARRHVIPNGTYRFHRPS